MQPGNSAFVDRVNALTVSVWIGAKFHKTVDRHSTLSSGQPCSISTYLSVEERRSANLSNTIKYLSFNSSRGSTPRWIS